MNNRIGIIPNIASLLDESNISSQVSASETAEAYLRLSESERLFFEYNDFFNPHILDDPAAVSRRVSAIKSLGRDRSGDSLHGAFLDINPASDDPAIVKVATDRINQSISIASSLGVKRVVFHTNYITSFLSESYRKEWIKRSVAYYQELCSSNPGTEILIENMFDESPELISGLANGLTDHPNFGICLDYAHARIFGKDPEAYVRALSPYIHHMHINDNFGISDDHLPLGKGDMEWTTFKALLDKYGLNRNDISVLIEHRGLECIRSSVNFLKSL